MNAGELEIKGIVYDLKASKVKANKDRFYTTSLSVNGKLIVNQSGNTPKKRWNYTGKTEKNILDNLENDLDIDLTGSFRDHNNDYYSICFFEFERQNIQGNFTFQDYTLNVSEV